MMSTSLHSDSVPTPCSSYSLNQIYVAQCYPTSSSSDLWILLLWSCQSLVRTLSSFHPSKRMTALWMSHGSKVWNYLEWDSLCSQSWTYLCLLSMLLILYHMLLLLEDLQRLLWERLSTFTSENQFVIEI
jgi:hypothetical protein